MKRKEELLNVFNNVDASKKAIAYPLIDDVIFLEERLTELKKYPFIKVHPSNPMLQKPTAAAKQYKEFLQQYNNCIKMLCSLLHNGADTSVESPLRKYLRGIEND